jgi:HSP20 family protein
MKGLRCARNPLGGRATYASTPALEVSGRSDAYVTTAETPSVESEDLDVTLERNLFTIQGQRPFKAEWTGPHYDHVERHYGEFRRSVMLPGYAQPHPVHAFCQHGLLHTALRQAEESQPRRIGISAMQRLPGPRGSDDV